MIIIGQGQSRQVQTLNTEAIGLQAAGTSPLKAIDKLPGVTFQSADAFGAYEWSTRISIRGFNQNQLGFTLDGVPLGDMSYGNHNGLHISRAIASENIGRVELAQGAGALGTASTSATWAARCSSSRAIRQEDDGRSELDRHRRLGQHAPRVRLRFETGAYRSNWAACAATSSIADQEVRQVEGRRRAEADASTTPSSSCRWATRQT